MRWFRDHIRRGSWVALVALAINIALSFGHVHAIGRDGSSELPSASRVAAIGLSDDGQGQGHHDGDHADFLCPICMAAGAIGHAVTAAPPVLPVVFAEAPIERTIALAFMIPQPPRAAFHSRGPPIS